MITELFKNLFIIPEDDAPAIAIGLTRSALSLSTTLAFVVYL